MIRYSGVLLNAKKCSLLQTEVKYLGYMVSEQGIAMDDSYVNKIVDWSIDSITTGKDLSKFLGFANYYRSYVPGYSQITAELNEHRNKRKIVWTESMVNSFNKVKQMFSKKPIRSFPQFGTEHPLELECDFSGAGLGCVITQIQNNETNTAARMVNTHRLKQG